MRAAILLLLLSPSLGLRWVFLTRDRSVGYLEASPARTSQLNEEEGTGQFGWCSGNFSRAPVAVQGTTVVTIRARHNVHRGPESPGYSGANLDAKVLVCGGADDEGVEVAACSWWHPELDIWSAGPGMVEARQGAAMVSLEEEGLVWVLGGRRGGVVLQGCEVMIYPVSGDWAWIPSNLTARESRSPALPGPQHLGMRLLPLPLAGHCALQVGTGHDRGVLVVGGGSSQDGRTLLPSPHLHLYHLAGEDEGRWSSSLSSPLTTGSRPLAPLPAPRLHHSCLVAGSGVWVAGGLTLGAWGATETAHNVLRYDYTSNTWREEAVLPSGLTGVKLVEVFGEVVILSTPRPWLESERSSLEGLHDFETVIPLPETVLLYPQLRSERTRLSPGRGSSHPRQSDDARGVWWSNWGRRPWVQVDLGRERSVERVILQTGWCQRCGRAGGAGQPVEVAAF